MNLILNMTAIFVAFHYSVIRMQIDLSFSNHNVRSFLGTKNNYNREEMKNIVLPIVFALGFSLSGCSSTTSEPSLQGASVLTNLPNKQDGFEELIYALAKQSPYQPVNLQSGIVRLALPSVSNFGDVLFNDDALLVELLARSCSNGQVHALRDMGERYQLYKLFKDETIKASSLGVDIDKYNPPIRLWSPLGNMINGSYKVDPSEGHDSRVKSAYYDSKVAYICVSDQGEFEGLLSFNNGWFSEKIRDFDNAIALLPTVSFYNKASLEAHIQKTFAPKWETDHKWYKESIKEKKAKEAKEKAFKLAQEKHLANYNLEGQKAWNERANLQNGLAQIGQKVCTKEDNKFGFIEVVSDKAVKVMWTKQVTNQSEGFFFGNIPSYSMSKSKEGLFDFQYRDLNELVWLDWEQIGSCPDFYF